MKKDKTSLENLVLNEWTGKFEQPVYPSIEETQERFLRNHSDYEKIPKPCPYGYDNDEVINNSKKILNQTKYSFNINIEFLFAASPEFHQHFLLRKKNSTDNESEDMEFGEFGCDLHTLQITNNVEVNLSNSDQYEATPEEFAEAIKGKLFLPEKGEMEGVKETFSKLDDYVKRNFTKEARRIVERLIYEFYAFNEPTEFREQFIDEILDRERKALQERIPATKGRVASKQRSDFSISRIEFARKCHKKLKELESEKLRLNKNQLAEKLFPDVENPRLYFSRKLKELDLTFEKILKHYKSINSDQRIYNLNLSED